MTDQLKGLLLTTLGVLLIVPDSLFVRLIDAEPMVTAFWRSLTSGAIVFVILAATSGLGTFVRVIRSGWPGWLYIVLMATTAPGFVLAVTNTSVANVVFIFATMPVFAAIASRVILGEAIGRRMILTMAVVMAGLGIIALGSGASDLAHWSGDLWAVYVSAAYAVALTMVRKVRDVPMFAGVPLSYLGMAAVLWFVTEPAAAWPGQAGLLLAHGAFIGVATVLLTLGPRYIGAAEVSLLILLESVLAPILVWAVVGEDPGAWALVGGAVVIGALVLSNLLALRATREGSVSRASARAPGRPPRDAGQR